MSKPIFVALAVMTGVVALLQPFRIKTVEPGYAGLKIERYGSQKGIKNAGVIDGGAIVINKYTTDLKIFPVTRKEFQFTNKKDQYSAEAQALNVTIDGTTFTENVAVNLLFPIDKLTEYYAEHKQEPSQFIQGNFYSILNSCYTQTVENFGEDAGGIEAVDYLSLRSSVAQAAMGCVEEEFPYVKVLSLNVFDKPTYPESLANAIRDRNKALQEQQTAEAQKNTAEAQAAANLATAKGKNAIKVSNAEAEARVAAEQAKAANNPSYLKLLQLQNEAARIAVQRTRAEKWNGQEVAGTIVQTDNAQVATPTTSK